MILVHVRITVVVFVFVFKKMKRKLSPPEAKNIQGQQKEVLE